MIAQQSRFHHSSLVMADTMREASHIWTQRKYIETSCHKLWFDIKLPSSTAPSDLHITGVIQTCDILIFQQSRLIRWTDSWLSMHTAPNSDQVITSNYNACSRSLTSLVIPLQANGDSELRSKHSTSQPPPALSFTSDETWSWCDSLEAIAVFWLQASPEVSVSTRQQLDDNSWTRALASLLWYKAFVGFLNRHRYFCLILDNQYINSATY